MRVGGGYFAAQYCLLSQQAGWHAFTKPKQLLIFISEVFEPQLYATFAGFVVNVSDMKIYI